MSEGRDFSGSSKISWDGVQGVSAVIGAILTVGGILWGVAEYRGKLEAERAKETLSLLDIWETQGYLDSYRRLDQEIRNVIDQVPLQDLDAAKKDPDILNVLYQKASSHVLDRSEAIEDFERVVYFFERMQICVQAKLCSRDATLMFFEDTVSSFALVFSEPLKQYRTGQPMFYDSFHPD